ELGGEDDVVAAAAGERLADDLLGLASRVDICGVDEVDTGAEGGVDDADAVVVVRVAPGAEHHGAEAQRADGDAGAAEGSVLHGGSVIATTPAKSSDRGRRRRVGDRHGRPVWRGLA